MNVLESPIDALVLSHGILNIVNNLWTWVAFVTAAVSFWRIRAAGDRASFFSVKRDSPASTSNVPQKVREIPQLDKPVENPRVQISALAATQSPAPAAAASSEAVSDFEVNGVTKGKFTVHYEDEGESYGELTSFGEGEDKESDILCCDWRESWERVLRTRSGEMNWYRYQDLAVINGNVVRLWDGGVWKEECSRIGGVW